MAQGALPGFRDFYPTEFARRAYLARFWRDVARGYAFVEYDGPPLEPLELYTRKSGDEMVAQLYNLPDKGGREVALRPEMTPTLARRVAARANALRKPVRWFSLPQLFRYERQQKGRLREHFQLNVDIVGEADVTADAELLAVAVECMRAFGLGPQDVRARVSDRRLLTAILRSKGIPESDMPRVFALLDKGGRHRGEIATELKREVPALGDVDLTSISMQHELALDSLRRAFGKDAAVAERIDEIEKYVDYLGALGVRDWVNIDLTIVRGLAYYTGIVFELFDAQGEFRAICGGGRYDTLLKSLSDVDLPALGFGMGDVVLGELLRARGRLPATTPGLDYWVAYEDPALLNEAMQVATALRRSGASVEYGLRPMRLGKQLETAAKAGALAAVILRGDGTRIQKDLASGKEEPFTFPNG